MHTIEVRAEERRPRDEQTHPRPVNTWFGWAATSSGADATITVWDDRPPRDESQDEHHAQVAKPAGEPPQEQVFAASYNEVLAFLKHQDDKINRVLTALAFLTTAGVTLYVFSRSDRGAYADFPSFANADVHIDDYFFGSFIIGVAVSVALALVSLDPTSFAPRFLNRGVEGERSLLYYAAIADQSPEAWRALFEEPELKDHYVRSLHADTHRLARRAVHKVRRFGSANAVVQFTVASLALLGATRLNHMSEGDRWILITGVLTIYVTMPLIDFGYLWLMRFPDVRTQEKRGAVAIAFFFLPFAAVAIAGLFLRYQDWQPVTFALFGTLLQRWIALSDWRRVSPWLQTGAMIAIACVGGVWFWLS